MHSRQTPLSWEIEDVWLGALADADIDPADAILYPLPGESGNGYAARYLYRHMEIRAEAEPEEIGHLVDEMNHDESIGAYRVVVFTERSIERVAALIRHELEHARQRDINGHDLMELAGVAEQVLAERVGGLCGGGFLYQVIPTELDANAAAASFVRRRYGADRIDQLLREGSKDGSAFRSLVAPPPSETLPERLVRFMATVPDLCNRFAERHGIAFASALNAHWRGAGDLWTRLVEDPDLTLPR